MENWLIPRLIHDEYLAGRCKGEMQAVSLYMDISGFTAITETLMRQQVEGAEVLTQILNQVFEPLIHAVYDRGGFITNFAGDAFTAIFPVASCHGEPGVLEAVEKGVDAARFNSRILTEKSVQQTPFGHFNLAIKQGLSMGSVGWKILGTPEHMAYYFHGEALDRCSEAGTLAQPGEILLGEELHSRFPQALVQTDGAGDHSVRKDQPGGIDPSVVSKFFPQLTNAASLLAGFRSTAIVFIAVQRDLLEEELDHIIIEVMQMSEQFGGYFNGVEFGDKGCKLELYFGAPISYENDLERALDFLLALRNQFPNALTWRAGVTFGTVFATLLGVPLSCKYTAFGNVVNLAARLLTLARWSQVLAPDSLSCWPGYRFEWLGEMSLKGFAEPVAICELQRERLPAEQELPAGFNLRMIGRQAELSRLLRAAHVLFEGHFAGAAIIYGEAGMGKSRLTHELRQALGERVTWFKGVADQTQRKAFNPFAYFLRDYFRQFPEATQEENQLAFGAKLAGLRVELADLKPTGAHQQEEVTRLLEELNQHASLLWTLAGLCWPTTLDETFPAQEGYENTLVAIKALLLAESLLKPVVLELEGVSWFDKASQEVLRFLSAKARNYPLWLLFTTRYTDDGAKPSLPLAEQVPMIMLELKALSKEELYELARQEFVNPMHEELLQLVYQKSQGNPYFAQQLLYNFREEGRLEVGTDGVWRLKGDDFELPASINAILVARIDRLPMKTQQVVKTAAALGREFEMRLLIKMLSAQMSVEEVTCQVQMAEEAQIWSAVCEGRYRFRQTLLREAAYEMQPRSQLRTLQRQAAQAAEQL